LACGRILWTGMHKKLPQARILPDMGYHGALTHQGTHRYRPSRRGMTGAPLAGAWRLPAWRLHT
jgi:hypothetical protein